MAIAPSAPERHLTLEESHGRVRSPLHKLRSTIRTYIGLEGVIITGLFLALWFWIGLVLDYGVFKAFALDWVQVLHIGVRGGILAALLAGLAAMLILKVVIRLTRDFHDNALALVLERRFPKVLGDRLITAVELANTKESAKFGYSEWMIEQTIHEAARRVDQLPVGEVFDWKRLVRGGVKVLALTVGLYLVVAGILFNLNFKGVGFKSSVKNWSVGWSGDGVRRFHEVSSIWFERNVLLRNVIWPRRAHLELLNSPKEGQTIGLRDQPPTIKVRALKWVIADDDTDEGWRAMRWTDQKAILGESLDDSLVPGDWMDHPRDPDAGLSIDEIELRLDKPESHDILTGEQHAALTNLLSKLEQRATDASMSRKFRVLQIPEIVYVHYKGDSSKSDMTLQKTGDNEFAGQFSPLTETIRFYAHGEDYYTPTRTIRVVPPPSLTRLTCDEFQPAYLYYRLLNGEGTKLRGKKQLVKDVEISLQGGDKSTIPLPAGSDLVMTGFADKDLREAPLLIPAKKGAGEINSKAELLEPRKFQVRFDNVRAPLDFNLEFTDTDSVKSLRHVEVVPLPDRVPEVTEFRVEYIRRTPQGFMVTPIALIPFSGTVSDDIGLDKVRFAYTLTKIDRQSEQKNRGLLILSAAYMLPFGPGNELIAAKRLAALTKEKESSTPADEPKTNFLKLFAFDKKLADQRGEFFDLPTIEKALANSPRRQGLFNKFNLEPDNPECGIDLKKEIDNLKLPEGSREVQPRYRMQIWIEAIDNNIEAETGPGHSLVKERLPFIVVSEEELLSEIAKQEEDLYTKLSEVVGNLNQSLTKLDALKQDLLLENFDKKLFTALSVRAEEEQLQLDKLLIIVNEVKDNYDVILKELKTNRVSPEMVARVEKGICKPLETSVLADVGDFAVAKKALEDFGKVVDGNEPDLKKKIDQAKATHEIARTQVEITRKRLADVLDKMQQLADINKLIKLIVDIEQGETTNYNRIQELKAQEQERLLDKAIGGGDKKEDEPKDK